MALYKERFAAFEYDKEWLIDGFAISPFSLPLEQKVFIPKIDPFEGISEYLRTACPMAGEGCWLTALCRRIM